MAPDRSERRRRVRGFTLIEALVALVIVGASGMALFSWINASLESMRRVELANARSRAQTDALEFMQSVNPMLRPQGEADLAGARLRWRSELQGPRADGVGYPQGSSLFQVGLYSTRVQVTDSEGQAWFEFDMQQVGFERVRSGGTPMSVP